MSSLKKSQLRTPGTEQPILSSEEIAVSILQSAAIAMSNGMVAVSKISPDGGVFLNNYTAEPGSSGGLNFFFPCDGFVVALSATSQDGSAESMASLSLRVQQNGNTDVFQAAAGGGSGFMPFAQISGNAEGKFLLRRRFVQATPWQFYVFNATGDPITCDIGLHYVNTSNMAL